MAVSQAARAPAAVAIWQPVRSDQEGQPPGLHGVAAPLWTGVSGALEDYVMALLVVLLQAASVLWVHFVRYIVSDAPVKMKRHCIALVITLDVLLVATAASHTCKTALFALNQTEQDVFIPVQIFLGQQPVVVVHNPEAGR